MARPSKEISEDTVDRLLEGAERLFALHGMATRLEDIAASAGISRPSLLYHFASKGSLYEAVVQRIFAALGQALSGAMLNDEDFDVRVFQVVSRFSSFWSERPDAATIVLRELIAPEGPGHPLLIQLGGPMIDQVEGWIYASGRIRPGVSVRSLLMHVVSDTLLRNGTGELKSLFWKSTEEPASWPLVQVMLLAKDVP